MITASTVSPVAAVWSEMVTTALLGTDRRDPPAPADGPFADLAALDPQPTPSQRLLQQLAAVTAVRRAGLLPGPAASRLQGPRPDPRPATAAGVSSTWRRIVSEWPVLEDEWLLAVIASGRRLAPELVVPLLVRHRSDAVRHARVVLAAGPLASWLVDLSPRLAPSSSKLPSAEAVASLPELAMLPELVPLLAAPPRQVAAALTSSLSAAVAGAAHRAVLVNAVARVAPSSLAAAAAAFDRVDPSSSAIGIAMSLASMARLRLHSLTELEPA